MANTLSRRNALLGALALPAAALPVAAVPAIAASTAESELDALIARHIKAKEIDNWRWDALSEIDDTIGDARPICRVQTGRQLGFGRNDDGSENWTPIYSWTVEDIEKLRDDNIRHLVRMWGTGKGGEERAQQIREKRTAWADGKIAELRAIEAERKRIEDEVGYTAAMEAAIAASDVVRECEAAILALVPDTLTAAARKARWIAQAYRDDSYLSDRDEAALLDALDAIASAVPS